MDRLAIDSTSGNLYYTCVGTRFFGFDGVSVITPKGDSRDLVKRGYTLRDIVVDPEEGYGFCALMTVTTDKRSVQSPTCA